MNRIALFLLALCIPLTGLAQDKGITFLSGVSWEEIKTQAKSENKYIFVDAYATWCGPCKAMEKKVYSSETVGHYMNDRFISVRVQMDKTDADNEQVQKWYADAASIEQQYKVTDFPTYLFFAPDGRIVHRGRGEVGIDEFLGIAGEAIDPTKQSLVLLENYRQGRKDY